MSTYLFLGTQQPSAETVGKIGDGKIKLRSLGRPTMTMNYLKLAVQKGQRKTPGQDRTPFLHLLITGPLHSRVDYKRQHLGEG